MKRAIREQLLRWVTDSPSRIERVTRFFKEVQPSSTVAILDYPVECRPRYGHGSPPHPLLQEIIARNRDAYRSQLQSLLGYRNSLTHIPLRQADINSPEPAWLNGWLPALDAAALYGLLCLNNPRRYFEVGSGNSTKFARRAIRDHNLRTTILSLDPQPRAEVDAICDRLVRQPLEEVDLSLFDELEAGDILFVDCSHYVLMNSDATIFFLELLPRLRPGVLVEIHDIFLPADYPAQWSDRFYSEQYVLAAYLLAGWPRIETMLPNYFVTTDAELSEILAPLWKDIVGASGQDANSADAVGFNTGGGSYWLKVR